MRAHFRSRWWPAAGPLVSGVRCLLRGNTAVMQTCVIARRAVGLPVAVCSGMAATQPVAPPDDVAVAGLVVGIVAIVVAWVPPLGAVAPLTAVTLSSLGTDEGEAARIRERALDRRLGVQPLRVRPHDRSDRDLLGHEPTSVDLGLPTTPEDVVSSGSRLRSGGQELALRASGPRARTRHGVRSRR